MHTKENKKRLLHTFKTQMFHHFTGCDPVFLDFTCQNGVINIYGKHLTLLAIQFKSRIDEAVYSFVAFSNLTFASRHNVTV